MSQLIILYFRFYPSSTPYMGTPWWCVYVIWAIWNVPKFILREYHVNGTKNIQKHMKVSNMTRKKWSDKILYSRFAIHILIFMKILSMSKKELYSFILSSSFLCRVLRGLKRYHASGHALRVLMVLIFGPKPIGAQTRLPGVL